MKLQLQNWYDYRNKLWDHLYNERLLLNGQQDRIFKNYRWTFPYDKIRKLLFSI